MARRRNNRPNRNPNRKKGNNKQAEKKAQVVVTEITYIEGVTVAELAEKLHRNSSDIIKLLFMAGDMATINSSLDDDTVELICSEYKVECTKEEYVDVNALEDNEDDEKNLVNRAPIVTIMGHVDHGKTTLLDTIRKTKVVDSEHGGITQHIGAYQILVKGKPVTFLDTPGHEAFTAMRSRGAEVTDICIIVVAADDGVMPQTIEAIDHAKAAGVPIIVAVNKIDKEGANLEHILGQMSDLGLVTEAWGGDTIFCEVSAKQKIGIDNLLENILLVSEVQELKANPNKEAFGSVIEAKLDKGRGPVATLLVKNGTLNHGDTVVVGATFGRVRKMTDDEGNEITSAGPSMPVEVIGLNDVPEAGDTFKAFESDKEGRQIGTARAQQKVLDDRKETSALGLDDIAARVESGEIQTIPVIIKADVQGSAEALKDSLEKLDLDTVTVDVIRSTVGGISESDIMLADASKAIVVGFNVRPTANVRKKAEELGVDIRLHNVIYKVIEEIQAAMKGMLAPVYEEVIFGEAEVRQLFKVSKIGTIAGCMVTDGKIVKDCKIRLIRDGVVVYTGVLSSLKRFQNDAKEVTSGYDCGLTIANFNDIKEGDIVEAFGDVEVEQ